MKDTKNQKFVPAKSTLEAIKDREQFNEFAIPSEIARPLEIINPPSLDGQKLLKYMMFKAGWNMKKRNFEHSFYLSELKDHPGIKKHYNLKEADALCAQLMNFIATTRDGLHFDKGVMLQYARSNSNKHGRIVITYIFGEKFIRLLEESLIYTLIDCSSVFYFKNRHSMQIYDFVASFHRMRRKSCHEFTLEDFRKLLGLKDSQYSEFAELKRRVLDPTMKDIEKYVSQFSLSYQTERTGKPITHIILYWSSNCKQEKMEYEIQQNNYIPGESIKLSSLEFYSSFPSDLNKPANESWREFCTQELNIKSYSHFHGLFKMYIKDTEQSLSDPQIKDIAVKFANEHYDENLKYV